MKYQNEIREIYGQRVVVKVYQGLYHGTARDKRFNMYKPKLRWRYNDNIYKYDMYTRLGWLYEHRQCI